MKKNNRIISLFLSFIMILTVFVGCSSDSSSDDNNDSTKKNHKGNSSVSDENYDSDENEDIFEIDKPISSTVSGPTLPSPDAYFNNQLIRNQELKSTEHNYQTINYCTNLESLQACLDYVLLLNDKKYQLELTTAKEETLYTLHTYIYTFDYIGSENVPQISYQYTNVETGDLIILIQNDGSAGHILMSLVYSIDAFEFKDFGDRTSYTMLDLSDNKDSGSNSNSDSSNDYGSALDCTDCKGSKKCKNCGGDGLVWSSAADKENRICPKCHTNKGKCPTCRGTGKRFN